MDRCGKSPTDHKASLISSTMQERGAIETLICRDRAFILTVLAGITGLAWFYLLHLSRVADSMPSIILIPAPWTMTDAALMFVMWAVMMLGMMLPSAAPMILLYGLVVRKQVGRGVVFAPVGVFAAGYLIAWTGFSFLATILQWQLEQTGLVASIMSTATPGSQELY